MQRGQMCFPAKVSVYASLNCAPTIADNYETFPGIEFFDLTVLFYFA